VVTPVVLLYQSTQYRSIKQRWRLLLSYRSIAVQEVVTAVVVLYESTLYRNIKIVTADCR